MNPTEPGTAPLRELRDPLTGQVSIHNRLAGEPLPLLTRQLPPAASSCPLCLLGGSIGERAWDGDCDREVLAQAGGCIAVPNRWPVFGPGSLGEMVLPRRHAEHLAELSIEEMSGLLDLLVRRTDAALVSHATAFGFVNVGVQAGGSQPHLHAQVHALHRTPVQAFARIRDLAGLGADIVAAVDQDLVLNDRDEALVWVPHAPFAPVEIRIYASFSAAPRALLDLVCRVEDRLGQLPYNLLCHPFAHRVLLQWLPRVDLGPVIPWMCDAVFVQQHPAQIADLLRA